MVRFRFTGQLTTLTVELKPLPTLGAEEHKWFGAPVDRVAGMANPPPRSTRS